MKFTAAIALFFAASASAYNTQPPADRRAFLAKAGAVSAAFVAATPAANAIFGIGEGPNNNPSATNNNSNAAASLRESQTKINQGTFGKPITAATTGADNQVSVMNGTVRLGKGARAPDADGKDLVQEAKKTVGL